MNWTIKAMVFLEQLITMAGVIITVPRRQPRFSCNGRPQGCASCRRRPECGVKTADGSKDMMSSGSDGKKRWHNTGPFRGDATGSVGHFVDSQTSRAIARLFDDNNALKDLGKADNKFAPQSASSKVIEVKSSKGLATRYFIDNKSSLITRLEFETGEFYTLLYDKKKYPSMASFVFSDYRDVNGIPTPFKIAVYKGLVQIEEMTFTSVQYNTGVKDSDFVP
jgi:hypothetical protein